MSDSVDIEGHISLGNNNQGNYGNASSGQPPVDPDMLPENNQGTTNVLEEPVLDTIVLNHLSFSYTNKIYRREILR